MTSIRVEVKTLPKTLQNALNSVGYGRKDIGISARETTSLLCLGGDGYRAFVVVVNLATGESKRINGSWGGSNMFSPNNAVDTNDAPFVIPADGAVIHGSIGGGKPVYASIEVTPATLSPMLPATGAEASPDERTALRCLSYKSGYRKSEMERLNVLPATVEACIAKGWVSRNKAGALSLTTAGKNVSR